MKQTTRRQFGRLTAGSIALLSTGFADQTTNEALDTDVCVYGGTASGVMAALAAAKDGWRVTIVEPSRWLGGMTGGGLDHVDWGREEAVGGSTRRILERELDDAGYRKLLGKLVEEHGIAVVFEHRLGRVRKRGADIEAIYVDHAPPDDTGCPTAEPIRERAKSVSGKVFIDCSYEGDLMAKTGVRYAWGRESRDQYNESLAGVRPNVWEYDIDPYIRPGDPKSGVLPLLQDVAMQPLGAADKLTRGYCFRYKFTNDDAGWPILPPPNYDPGDFEIFRRGFTQGIDVLRHRRMKEPGTILEQRGGLYLMRTGNIIRSLMTTTVFGCNSAYPDGDWANRCGIWKFHQHYLRGLTHFLRTDPSVPDLLREKALKIRLRRGPIDETQGWPHQLYVREARRMVSDYVVTQHDLAGMRDPEDSVGLASYGVDDFPYATYPFEGGIALSGGEFSVMYLPGRHNGIYRIPYRAIRPRKAECRNLLAPVCVSASHIAMTSIRMEPVWMILGESAGAAASLALRANVAVQDVDYRTLRRKLLALEQRLEISKA